MALAPGDRIGVYQIQSQLGAGGMGRVYRAHDTKLRRDVAIKILPDDLADDPERIARFQREAQVLAALNHQHIAHYHTGGVPGRHELDGTQELNWHAVMMAIADTGFTGYVAHEFVPTRDPLKSLREARQECDV